MTDLAKLSDPFPADDIEWRVSRAGVGPKGTYCMVLAYITARAVQQRLDNVCGPENWRQEEPRILTVDGKSAFACGLSIRVEGSGIDPLRGFITKWDVSEPTNIEAAKGGWSGAMKRAGAHWGIGRYLYHLDETYADVNESPVQGSRDWNYARLPEKHGGGVYYWKTPTLPGWALPKEPEHEITEKDLGALKRTWKDAFGVDGAGADVLRQGFELWVKATVGEFPATDFKCWTRDAWEACVKKVAEGVSAVGIDSEIPFG